MSNLREELPLLNQILKSGEFRKKQIAAVLIASTLNPIPMMDIANTIKQMAIEKDEELYDGTQFESD
tara:strand:- start:191 stop:391 length:201 start_codon:yes stop_codon:yes gene_type:complete